MIRFLGFLAAVAVGQTLIVSVFAQAQVGDGQARLVEKVRTLSRQLRWHAGDDEEFAAIKDKVTREILSDIDAFISDSFQSTSATPELVKGGLDALLDYKSGDEAHNVAFIVDLPQGHFLIVGIEVSRWVGAFAEDAISFRAYKQIANKFVFTTATGNLSDSLLMSLHAEALSKSPLPGEFWFLAMARMPPLSPPSVVIRLYAFDGQKFRIVWAPKNVEAEAVDKAVVVTGGGFLVDSLFDPTGMAAGSPSVMIHEQYVLTAVGPKKTAEWRTGYPAN